MRPLGTAATILAIILYLLGTIPGWTRLTPPTPAPATHAPAAPTADAPAVATAHAPAAMARPARLRSEATLRSGPGGSHPVVAVLQRGAAISVTGMQDGYYRVRLASGTDGWVWGPLVELSPWPTSTGQFRWPDGGRSPAVVGYYVFDGASPSYSSMIQHASALSAIAPWAWRVDARGRVFAAAEPTELQAALRAAGRLGLQRYPLVHNYHGGRFDADAAHGLLTNEQSRRDAVEALTELGRQSGVEGMVLNLENVPPADREALSAFTAQLATALRVQGMRLAVAVAAKTSDRPDDPFRGAYDYPALGRVADAIWLMTYDEHYRLGPPGPVASFGWVEQVVRYATGAVEPARLVLGLPAYGYLWSREGPARALTHAQAMAELRASRATLRWHPVHKVPYFADGSREVWFEDRYSAASKVSLVRRYGLGGVAVWRLGQEDPKLWEALQALL